MSVRLLATSMASRAASSWPQTAWTSAAGTETKGDASTLEDLSVLAKLRADDD